MNDTREKIRELPTSELVIGLRSLSGDFMMASLTSGKLDQIVAMVLEEAADRLEHNTSNWK